MRTLLVWLTLILSTIPLSVLALLTFPFDRKGNTIHRYARLWGRLILWASGTKVEVKGAENIPKGPAIIMSNHLSAFDIFVLSACLPVQFRWLAKASLFRIPFLGWAMSCAGYIPVERTNPREAQRSIQEASERIRSGTPVLIFPEGTRSRDGSLGPFKRGGFRLALKAGVPIVPVAIKGTYEIMPRGSLKISKPQRVTVLIGRPIPTEGSGPQQRDALMEEVRRAIEEGLKEAEGCHPR